MRIVLYDTTLRDGTQGEGIAFSARDKLRVARMLDELGVAYIEGGWPGSNPKDMEFFRQAANLSLNHAVITAFGSTRRADTSVEQDAQIRTLLEANTRAVAIFGKTWDLHVTRVLNTTLAENLRMIRDSVTHLLAHGREVIYDAEHFFDGYKADRDYALQTLRVAVESGASWVVLCDTNGGTLPWEVEQIVADVRDSLAGVPLGIHTHNDSECGVANTLMAIRAGCTQVQGTINGYGERCGNANLASIIPDLQLKMGYRCLSDEQLRRLTDVARTVSELANLTPEPHQPFVGRSAFAHKGGAHVNATVKLEEAYQHIDPAKVGNQRRVVVSELAGKDNIAVKRLELGLDGIGRAEEREVLRRIKELEHRGYQFESAEGSLELMLRRIHPDYQRPFELVDFWVLVRPHPDSANGGMAAEATVKVRVGDQMMHTAADGNGPVNALDAAMRKALVPFFPVLADVRLVDYKVRILDGDTGTAATTRVLIDTACNGRSWTTVGSSTNIIEASWQALADSLEYALLVSSQPEQAAAEPEQAGAAG
ncbi:MAG: citramalate synthase [Anaerolineae bacterium]|nr:citramalate synthase [Anaerolineae bacterium]